MPLPSFLQRFRRQASSESATDATSLSPASVEEARVRARRRLIGMAVLVGAGVIGFPWLFETQPRSMSQDIQVVQARQGAEGEDEVLAVTGAGRPTRSASGKVGVASVQPPAPDEDVVDDQPAAKAAPHKDVAQAESPKVRVDADKAKAVDKQVSKPAAEKVAARPADKAAEKPVAKPADKSSDKAAAKSADKPATKPAEKPAAKTPDKPADKSAADKTKPADKSDKDSSRYVVQVGAFAEAASAQTTRQKIERLGIKTYAQEVSTPAGKRIRVRIGPFTDKAEADKALANLRKAGINGNVLTL